MRQTEEEKWRRGEYAARLAGLRVFAEIHVRQGGMAVNDDNAVDDDDGMDESRDSGKGEEIKSGDREAEVDESKQRGT